MSEEIENKQPQVDEAKTETVAQQDKAKNDPVHRVTKIVLYIAITLFVVYLITDRLAPWTDQARVQAYVIPIVPQVAGNIIDINVEKDQVVKAGDILFKIDPSDYLLARESAESALELAGQEIGASTAEVATAQAKVVEAKINLEYVNTQSKRVFELEKDKILPVSDGDKARAAIEQAKTLVVSAQAELEKSEQQLGQEGNDNPKIRSAIAALKKAQIDLARTTVIAPTKGGITNLVINEGQYASVGTPLMTFVDFESVWVKADFRENSIANIKIGDSVDLALDVVPGKIFKGKVSSIGFAVDDSSSGEAGQLVTVKGKTGWLRDSQRFPVNIKFVEGDYPKGQLRVGGQADAQVYTSNNFVINSFGWIWIRILTWASYAY